MVLAASGVDHEHLLGYVDLLLKDWHKGTPMEKPKSTYVGGDSRHRADLDVIWSFHSLDYIYPFSVGVFLLFYFDIMDIVFAYLVVLCR